MALDDVTANAIEVGRRQAKNVLEFREQALELRKKALEAHPKAIRFSSQAFSADEAALTEPFMARTAGVLIAEGDSWFDYPLHDILKMLEDRHGYDVESVAHKGDPIEEMAYGGNQLEDLTRRIEKLNRRGVIPKAILLSGGGNDVAGDEFGMLLNHANSALAGLNKQVLNGVIDERIRTAYVTIISAVTAICEGKLALKIPILIHGYDFPVPDGRGFLGGWGPLPGPWLEPGFRQKGYENVDRRIELAHELIERFNVMLKTIADFKPFAHVTYVNLRNTLSTGADYKTWWANELHPTEKGFDLVTNRFVDALNTLP